MDFARVSHTVKAMRALVFAKNGARNKLRVHEQSARYLQGFRWHPRNLIVICIGLGQRTQSDWYLLRFCAIWHEISIPDRPATATLSPLEKKLYVFAHPDGALLILKN